MVWRVVNVPKKDSGIKIKCTSTDNGFRVHTDNGYEICIINSESKKGIAEDIEYLLTKFRDIGFEHGREHIRNALGIDI